MLPSHLVLHRLSDDMYSQEDVEGILNSLRGCVVTNLRQEVGRVSSLCFGAVRILQYKDFDARHSEVCAVEGS